MENTREEQAQIDLVAAVDNAPGTARPHGPFEDATDWEMRQLYAESWVNVGFTNPADVAPWIAEGVYDAEVTFNAYREGSRPTDPWVKRSHASLALPTQKPLIAPGLITAMRNRAQARRAWRKEMAESVRIRQSFQRDMQQLADIARSLDFDEGFGAVNLEALTGSGVTIVEQDVLRAYDEFATMLDTLHQALDSRPSLGRDDLHSIRGHLSYWITIGSAVEREVHICDGATQQAIAAQVSPDLLWLRDTAAYYSTATS